MNTFWMTVVNHVILLLLQLIVISILVIFHRYAPVIKTWIDRHTTLTERQILSVIGREAFQYAESTFSGAPGQVKLDQALKYASSVAGGKGLNLSSNELRAAVEQAVQEAKRVNAGTAASTVRTHGVANGGGAASDGASNVTL